MELEVTWKRLLKVWWSLTWRYLLCSICSFIIGGILGMIIGVVMTVLGEPKESVQLVCGIVGAILGLGLSFIPLQKILNKDFGEFRLVLLQKSATAEVNL